MTHGFAEPEYGTPIAIIQAKRNANHPQQEKETMADDLGTDGLENRAKGTAKEAEGKVRNAVGGLTGNTSEQLKGKGKELEGKAQRKIGEAEDNADLDR